MSIVDFVILVGILLCTMVFLLFISALFWLFWTNELDKIFGDD